MKLDEFDHPGIIIYSGVIPEHRLGELKAIGVDKFMEKSASLSVLTSQLQKLLVA
ncbi:hypothetical protein [Dyadobacter psychrotolerans]|uniref:hypothetical protein n=1 Tax=Dyadobacter psychrotolerans TaxID=2541721 RepID=UPI0014055938|nr:hypothetical protein [Dyadobacter psychrotolerans]